MAKILIVEDDPAGRDYLRTLLTASNHRVVEAADGEEGLKSVQKEHPDLVITDILMPTMDGFEFVRRLRKDPDTAATRVVFCSATYLQREAETLAKSCGVIHILLKPAEPAEVNRVVQTVLHESQTVSAPPDEEFHLQHVGLVSDMAVRKSAQLQIANERLAALILVGNQLASEPDAKKLIDKFCKGARYVLAGKFAAVVLLKEDEENLETASATGLPTGLPGTSVFASLARAVRKQLGPTKNTVRVYDESILALFKNDTTQGQVQGCLGSAITLGKHLYGILLVVGKVGGKAFTEEDEQVAGTLAVQMAVAYENVLRVDKLQVEITERKRVEEALRRSESRNRELIEHTTYGIYRSDPRGNFLEVNPALVKMLGYSSAAELLRLNLNDDVFRCSEDRERILEEIKKIGQVHGIETQWKKKDGSTILVRLSVRIVNREPSEFEVIVEDITNVRALEKHNRELQKFEAIGQLAGGVAHDFNNVIGAIMGWAELAQPVTTPGSRLHGYLDKIRNQAERAAGLTRQLLAFARRQILEPRNINLNQAIKEVMGLLKPVIGAHIEVKMALAETLDMTRADPTQLEQVIMNLCLNARDAMPRGGELLIETSNVEFDEDYCQRYSYARPGSFVLLSISDTGEGMDKATIDRIFEPFFTTKEMGKGTGLGLATVYGIVKQHGGFIQVYSELRCGSTFRVYLPRATGEFQPSETKGKTEPVRGGTETILVAEDHEGNREIATAILEKLGYTVLSAADGEAAVRVFESNSDQIALVLMDVLMPKLAGPEALAKMRKRKPGLPALFTTGYSTELTHLELLAKRGAQILQKPYSSASLGLRVRQILDRKKS